MKINQQNYLEVKKSPFFAVCSFCLNDITSTTDVKNCGKAGCLYKICSRSQCNHFLENKYYCNNCIIVNRFIDNDTTERLFMGSNNNDCVTVFRNNEGDDSIQSVALILKSMGDITLFGKLPDYSLVDVLVVPDPELLDSAILPRLIDCITLLTPTEFTIDDDVSVDSNISDDCSDIIPVDENSKQYLMKGGNCVLRNCNSKTFDFGHNFNTREKLELMNEKWKSQVFFFQYTARLT